MHQRNRYVLKHYYILFVVLTMQMLNMISLSLKLSKEHLNWNYCSLLKQHAMQILLVTLRGTLLMETGLFHDHFR